MFSIDSRGRRESPAFRINESMTKGMLEKSSRRGASNHRVLRRRRHGSVGALCSRVLGPRSSLPLYNQPWPQALVGSMRRPQAARRTAMAFEGPALRRACNAAGRPSMDPAWLTAYSHVTSKEVTRRLGERRNACSAKRCRAARRVRIGQSVGVLARRGKRCCRSR